MAKKRPSKKRVKRGTAAKKSGGKLLIPGLLVALALAFVVYRTYSPPVEPGDGILATPIDMHDFGMVSLAGGVVSTEVPLVNVGKEDLVISFLDSSCGCTSARVINNGKEGPVFGMSSHGKSPANWRTVIKPNEQAKLRIYYDPTVHPKFRGLATRVITITTNERNAPQKQVRIKVNQTD